MNRAVFSSAWIGLGGNLGKVREAMACALRHLDQHACCRVVAVSGLYRTPPWGKTDQPWFLNACACLSTTLAPDALLEFCLDLETAMKRERTEKWGPRTLDIDLLMYENVEVCISDHLVLPHPGMKERAFVLVPLAEIAPGLVFEGQTVAAAAERFRDTRIVRLDSEENWWKV